MALLDVTIVLEPGTGLLLGLGLVGLGIVAKRKIRWTPPPAPAKE